MAARQADDPPAAEEGAAVMQLMKATLTEEFVEPMQDMLSMELRRLSQAVQRDMRSELRRMVDAHAGRLDELIPRVEEALAHNAQSAPLHSLRRLSQAMENCGGASGGTGESAGQMPLFGFSQVGDVAEAFPPSPVGSPDPPAEQQEDEGEVRGVQQSKNKESSVAPLSETKVALPGVPASAPAKKEGRISVSTLSSADEESFRKRRRRSSLKTGKLPPPMPPPARHGAANAPKTPDLSPVGGDFAVMLEKYRRQLQNQTHEEHSGFYESLMTLRSTIRSPAKLLKAMKTLVQSDGFDYVMGVFLLANAISIGIQVDYAARNAGEPQNAGLFMLDVIFCVVFSLELFFRMVFCENSLRAFFLTDANVRWNWFDGCIVTFMICDIIIQQASPKRSDVQERVGSLGIVRMFRLVRVVRLVRLVRLIPELKSMVYLIRASMGSFFWTMMLILITVYGFAVYFTEMATDLAQKGSDDGIDLDLVKLHWGSMSTSMLSLFMAMTGGDDWRNFLDVFRPDASQFWATSLLFALYVAFMMLVMLNLVTGVFVDGAARIIQEDKDQELVKAAAKAFDKADVDHNDTLSAEELNNLIGGGVLDEYCQALDICPADADTFFRILDQDNSGEVDCIEFMRGTLRLRGPAKSADVATMQYLMKSNFKEVMDDLAELKEVFKAFPRPAHVQDLRQRACEARIGNECPAISEKSFEDELV